MQLVSQEYIEIAADVRSGKPRIAGTRIAVEDIAVLHLKLGYSLVAANYIRQFCLCSRKFYSPALDIYLFLCNQENTSSTVMIKFTPSKTGNLSVPVNKSGKVLG